MRIAIFFGLTYIGDSIAAQTGFIPSEATIIIGIIIFAAVTVMDVVDLSKAASK